MADSMSELNEREGGYPSEYEDNDSGSPLSPDLVRRIQNAGQGLTPGEENRILNAMRAAHGNPPREFSDKDIQAMGLERFLKPLTFPSPFYKRPRLLAAGLLLVLGAALLFVFLRGGDFVPAERPVDLVYRGAPLRSLSSGGKILLIRGERRFTPGPDTPLVTGDILSIRRKGAVEFAWGLKGVFRLEGPALLELRELVGLERAVLELHYGSLFLLGDKHGVLKILTGVNVYQMVGTMARLYRKDNREELEVLKGTFEVRFGDQTTKPVEAGQGLYRREDDSGSGGAVILTANARKRLEKYNSTLSGLRNREHIRVQLDNEPAAGLSLPEIKARYGAVFRIQIKGRATLEGFYLSHGDRISIISSQGRFVYQRKQVGKITELRFE